jgi:hypothetical protein
LNGGKKGQIPAAGETKKWKIRNEELNLFDKENIK